jgi:large subunit ribosomal protein L21
MPVAKKTTKKEVKTTPKAPSAPAKAMADKKVVKAEKVVPNGSFAVVETGGKQYRVAVGETIKVEAINGELKEGDAVVFDKVLLIDNGTDSTDIGTPYIAGAKVTGTLVEIGRNAKVIVIKYKQKSRYFKKNGHRQPFFAVRIDKIS